MAINKTRVRMLHIRAKELQASVMRQGVVLE
jgi:hypothetical protein